MRRMLSLLAVVIAVSALSVISTGSASALGGEQLECRVVTGATVPAFAAPECLPLHPDSNGYNVSFEVFGGSSSDTYQWTVPSGFQDYGGCTIGVGCAFHVRPVSSDLTITVSVVVTEGSSHATLTADAFISATCGNDFC